MALDPGSGGSCCAMMAGQVTHRCEQCESNGRACPDQVVVYRQRFHEYGLPIWDSPQPSSYLVIQWCPWCGTRLPESLRMATVDGDA